MKDWSRAWFGLVLGLMAWLMKLAEASQVQATCNKPKIKHYKWAQDELECLVSLAKTFSIIQYLARSQPYLNWESLWAGGSYYEWMILIEIYAKGLKYIFIFFTGILHMHPIGLELTTPPPPWS